MNRVVTQQPTLSTNAYTAGDACGGLLTFDFGVESNTILISRAHLLDDVSGTPDEAAMKLHLFTDPTLVIADADPFAISHAAFLAGKYLGYIAFSSYEDTPVGDNTSKIAIVTDVNLLVPLLRSKVYGQLVCDATPTFAADQLTVALFGAEYA